METLKEELDDFAFACAIDAKNEFNDNEDRDNLTEEDYNYLGERFLFYLKK